MKPALSNPWRSRSASHSQSRTSVFLPGTALTSRALNRITFSAASRMLKTGSQYTPVLSIATCVQPSARSQSESVNKSSVMVEKVRVCVLPCLIRQATTVLACTSRPQQQGCTISMVSSLRPRCENLTWKSLLCVLEATVGGAWKVLRSGSDAGSRHQTVTTCCTPAAGQSVLRRANIFIFGGGAQPHDGSDRTLVNVSLGSDRTLERKWTVARDVVRVSR